MSEQVPNAEEEKKLVVFAPRIDPGLREQIEGIRSITGQTINDLGQEALRDWVDKKLADEDVRNKAMEGIQDEERRLQERRAAIEKVLGTSAATAPSEMPADTGSGRSGRRGKGTSE
ncbi:hypothetical protein ACWC4E_35165 [Streptomyces sp. NPDC001273]|uniref:hypothetical protein n=1 Tax=unclassified Streptomyces TaxID=2593676 RepID=UPI0033F3EB94